jgi:hypothetical protein
MRPKGLGHPARGSSLATAGAVLRRSGSTRLSGHISDDGLPAIVDVDVLDPNVLLAPVPEPSKNLDLCRIGFQQPCRGRSKGCDSSFGPVSPPSLARTDIVAACVHAIWIAKAASISSFGAAASIMASAAFKAISEIPPHGNRAAACNCNREAFTKSLDLVPRACFSRVHQTWFSPSGDRPSRGWR